MMLFGMLQKINRLTLRTSSEDKPKQSFLLVLMNKLAKYRMKMNLSKKVKQSIDKLRAERLLKFCMDTIKHFRISADFVNCGYCGMSLISFKVCSGCMNEVYCSRKCQKFIGMWSIGTVVIGHYINYIRH